MFNLDDCIAYITCRGSKILAERLEKRLEPWNITRVQWIALYYIGQADMITQKQLSDNMALKEPTVVRLIDRMEKEGFVVRECSDDDKRIKNLKLTDKGLRLNSELLEIAELFKNDAINGINEQDLAIFNEVLAKMISNTL